MSTINEVFRSAVYQLANINKSAVFEDSDGKGYAFLTPMGLCVLGVVDLDTQYGYVDIRQRVLMGELTPSFDLKKALRENHQFPEWTYGIGLIDGQTEVVSFTGTYRFIFALGLQSIQEGILIRFGETFAVPLLREGLKPIPGSVFTGQLKKYGANKLLTF
ncbi:MAG: hypothetical protein KIT50_12180 [Bacteroidetes bacterium]|nr:hypothetical protein [Bacteroidota bacterium]